MFRKGLDQEGTLQMGILKGLNINDQQKLALYRSWEGLFWDMTTLKQTRAQHGEDRKNVNVW